jgi:hypothetical protein
MGGIAGYRLVRALALGPRDSAWEAVPPGGREASVVVERCEPLGDALRGSDDALGFFFERRALQRRLASSTGTEGAGLGRGHVVVIRDLAATDTGGYCVRDRYDLSLGDLIRGRVRVRGDALHEIVSGVVAGLRAIERAAGRPHGDLDGDAVLLADPRAGRLRVGIQHPLPGRLLGKDLSEVRRDELRRLGLLIYELVMRRPFRDLSGYPVRDGSEWKALGAGHGFWLGLVNELLDPKGRGPTLEAVASKLDGLKYRKPGPSRLAIAGSAAAGVVLIGAMAGLVVLALRKPPLLTAEFDPDRFARWCAVSPGVQLLREKSAGMEGPDGELLRGVVGGLAGDPSLVHRDLNGDYFNPLAAVRALYSSRKVEAPVVRDGGLAGLIELVTGDWQKAREQTLGDDKGALEKLDKVAGVSDAALRMVDGEEGPGLAGLFASGAWPSRAALESKAEAWSGREGWARIAVLAREPLERVDGLVGVLVGGVPPGAGDGATTRENIRVPSATVEAVDALIAGVAEVGLLARELDALERRMEGVSTLSASLGGQRRMTGLPPRLAEELGDDPLLSALPGMAARIGAIGEGEGLVDLLARIERVERALSAVRGVVEGPWADRGIDLIRMRGALGAGFAPGALASASVDEIAARSEEWARVARAHPAYGEGQSPRPRHGVINNRPELESMWREAVLSDPKRSEEMASQNLAAEGEGAGIDDLFRRFDGAIARLELGPDWPSREEEIRADAEEAQRVGAVLSRVIADVHGEILQKPDELIAMWRDGGLLEPGARAALERLGGLARFRETTGGGFVADWESWYRGTGLDMPEAAKREPSKLFRASLKSFEQVIGRAAQGASAIPGELRGVGGYDWSPIEGAALELRARAVVSSLEGVAREAWGVRESGAPGGEIDRLVTAALEAEDARLARLNADLSVLSAVVVGLESCALPGLEGTPDGRTVGALLSRVEGEHAPLLGGAADVRAAASLSDRVLRVSASADVNELRGLITGDAGGGAHHAVRYAALRRAGEVGAGAWPADVPSMRAEADRLVEGLEAIRSPLDASGWERVSADAREILHGWWARGFGVARSEDDLRSLLEEGPGWFARLGAGWDRVADADRLDGAARFDAEAFRLRAAMLADAKETADRAKVNKAMAPSLEEDLKRRTRERLETLRGVGQARLDGATRGRALSWTGEIESALVAATGGKSGWDEREHGPLGKGLEGWTAEQGESADGTAWVAYRLTRGDRPIEIRFHLVQLSNGEQVFLAEDEFSVELFDWVLRARLLDAGEGTALGRFLVDAGFGRPLGPTSRSVQRGTRRNTADRASAWMESAVFGPEARGVSFPAYPAGLVDPSDPTRIAPEQGEPTRAHPVNFIPYDLAREIAVALGCDLPTESEFRAALGVAGPGARSGRWNLRDGSFGMQFRHFLQAQQNEVTHYRPGDNSYTGLPAEERVWSYDPGANQDDKLWFYETGEIPFQRGVRFRHLIGNVAEFVRTDGSGRGAMGASALSDPEAEPGRVFPVPGTGQGFVDAGLRLAIDADEFGSLGRSLERLIEASRGRSYSFGGG